MSIWDERLLHLTQMTNRCRLIISYVYALPDLCKDHYFWWRLLLIPKWHRHGCAHRQSSHSLTHTCSIQGIKGNGFYNFGYVACDGLTPGTYTLTKPILISARRKVPQVCLACVWIRPLTTITYANALKYSHTHTRSHTQLWDHLQRWHVRRQPQPTVSTDVDAGVGATLTWTTDTQQFYTKHECSRAGHRRMSCPRGTSRASSSNAEPKSTSSQ